MAYIRKRGSAYYLVHSLRRDGRVEQLHLAALGRHPRISDELVRDVEAKHPCVPVDWDRLREQVSREGGSQIEMDAECLERLIGEVRDFHLNIADIELPCLEAAGDRALRSQLLAELKLLRGTLDVKLNSFRPGGPVQMRGRYT